jgi:hypothetical protein
MLHHESMIGNQPPQPPGMSAARGGFGQQRSYRKSSNAPSQNFEPGAFKVDEAVKSQYLGWRRRKPNFGVALHLEVAAAHISTPHAAEICAP